MMAGRSCKNKRTISAQHSTNQYERRDAAQYAYRLCRVDEHHSQGHEARLEECVCACVQSSTDLCEHICIAPQVVIVGRVQTQPFVDKFVVVRMSTTARFRHSTDCVHACVSTHRSPTVHIVDIELFVLKFGVCIMRGHHNVLVAPHRPHAVLPFVDAAHVRPTRGWRTAAVQLPTCVFHYGETAQTCCCMTSHACVTSSY
jgi:hypothetical protein